MTIKVKSLDDLLDFEIKVNNHKYMLIEEHFFVNQCSFVDTQSDKVDGIGKIRLENSVKYRRERIKKILKGERNV